MFGYLDIILRSYISLSYLLNVNNPIIKFFFSGLPEIFHRRETMNQNTITEWVVMWTRWFFIQMRTGYKGLVDQFSSVIFKIGFLISINVFAILLHIYIWTRREQGHTIRMLFRCIRAKQSQSCKAWIRTIPSINTVKSGTDKTVLSVISEAVRRLQTWEWLTQHIFINLLQPLIRNGNMRDFLEDSYEAKRIVVFKT